MGAIIVVVAVGFYFIKGGGNLATLGNTSLRDLLASGQSQKCTFDNGQASGTIYVGAGKMRGDFSAKSGEENSQSHMIISNNIAYVWVEGLGQGYRMPFESLSGQGAQANGGIDADARVATKCEGWQAIETSFELPANVVFSEIGAPAANTNTNTQPAATSGEQSSTKVKAEMSYYEQQCAGCDMIPDATGKAECKASFDCP